MYKQGYLGVALGIVFVVIGLTIAANVYNTSSGNFTGITGTIMTYVVPVGAMGGMYIVAKMSGLI